MDFFLFTLFSKTISYEIISKNNPPTILKELTEIPIKLRKLLPYREKKVSTLEVIINTNIANFIVFFIFKPWVITVKIGIKDIGSIAINVLKKF
tara:strand:- start:15 stop:296 length:282 start_codon:yes stop_codon:yes gene_type:complete